MAIEIIAHDTETPEYAYAIELKSKFESWLINRKDKKDSVFIAPNVRLYGTEVRDLDILVFGIFDKGVSLRLNLYVEKEIKTANVYISNFCFIVNIREELGENIFKKNEDIWIKLNDREANFSKYNNEIMSSFKKFMSYIFKSRENQPFIGSILNFKNIDSNTGIKYEFPNFVKGEMTIEKLFQSYIYINEPKKNESNDRPYYYLTSTYIKNEDQLSYYEKMKFIVNKFLQIKSNIGKLTKIKLDSLTITRKDLPDYYNSLGKELLILRGGAGTGKTLKILNIAKELYDKGNRCLILTYNRALVADIDRLINLSYIKNDPITRTIKIKTIHSFLRLILDDIIHWKNEYISSIENEFSDITDKKDRDKIIMSKSGIYYLSIYNNLLNEAVKKINEFIIEKGSASYESKANFDFILIDEAQDWSSAERDILYKLFGSNKIIIADGMQQLIRTNQALNWKVSFGKIVPFKEISFPAKSLRQNEKLCILQNNFAKRYEVLWNVITNDSLNKGSIYVYIGDVNEQIVGFLKEFTKNYSNDKYDDLLFLAPSSMLDSKTKKTTFSRKNESFTVDEKVKRSFKYTQEWRELGLNIFDMTYVDDDTLPQSGEYRLVTYDSCRGLESYGVVALEMDVFFENKFRTYNEQNDSIKQGDILTQTRDDKALRFAAMWSLIVFSRPVELLVITIKNKDSVLFRTLKDIANNTNGIINIIE